MIGNMRPEVSVLIPAKDSATFLSSKVACLHEYLSTNLGATFEILIVPNGPEDSALTQTLDVVQSLTLAYPNVRCVYHRGLCGKAAALRAGFDFAAGDYIAFIDADLPFNLDFFSQAYHACKEGAELVTANRRIDQSVFIVPVPLLPLVYKRHWAGLAFNRMVRMLFPIHTLDTQAGLKYMSRRFAEKVFYRQLCTGFLLDVEIFLVARLTNVKHVEVPVHLHLQSEKSTVRLAKELGKALFDLAMIWFRYRAGEYHDRNDKDRLWVEENFLTSDDWGISPGVNEGILELAQRGVVRRVSMLANGEHLEYKLDELRKIKGIHFGLHFNLTHGQPLAGEVSNAASLDLYEQRGTKWFYKSPLQLVKATLFSAVKPRLCHQLAHAFSTQLSRLQALDLQIEYFDSHHHVHLLPMILSSIISTAHKNAIKCGRLVLDPWVLLSRKFPLVLLSVAAKWLFKKNKITYLKCRYPNYGQYVFPSRLRKRVHGLKEYEIIVHPAKYPDLHTISSPDQYNNQRVREYWTLRNFAPLDGDC